ncbi:transmembrane protein [Candidatus Nitrosoglobus terrae]|uniref:Transmembrane protein n=1 Tax=Candidatus Nitrosoglobus terrae TaxID=1630141 RepID=A0A1Q2SKP9_9GAMM|nr:hypothetical protein [Candidatus Nitrosoglobus terrae]BAW79687.1 transmembrane protein [Candidatus Nitrosoglobus terrae]
MKVKYQRYFPSFAWGLLALPPLRHILESSMVTHMLIQLPALAFVGWWFGQGFSKDLTRKIALWNQWGITGMVLVVITMFYWMLPRALDAAISEPVFEAAKFFVIPLFIGTAFNLSWSSLPPIAQGVLKLEFWATFMRLGWLYIVLPDRLCANYLLGDQRILGYILLILGSVWAVSWALKILFGIRWRWA